MAAGDNNNERQESAMNTKEGDGVLHITPAWAAIHEKQRTAEVSKPFSTVSMSKLLCSVLWAMGWGLAFNIPLPCPS